MQGLNKARRNHMNLIYKYHRPLSMIYHSNIIQVPAGAKWIAIDSEGFLWAYRSKPLIDNRAKRYRANGEEEKVTPHLFGKIAKWQDTLCPVMDCQWMIDIIGVCKFAGINEHAISLVLENKKIIKADYEHFMTHAASLLDEDTLEDLQDYIVPEKTVLGFLNVPAWAEWLCITNNGTIAVFDKEPTLINGIWQANGKKLADVGKVDSYDNWTKSKMKL